MTEMRLHCTASPVRSMMTSTNDIAIVVLAAGASRRMGKPKQMLKLGGRSLLDRALCQAAQTGCQVYAVLGEGQQACQQTLDIYGARCVSNPAWASGMGSSIQAAVWAVRAVQTDAGAILIMLVDQPGLSADLLNQLIARYRQGGQIVACEYAGTVGVPALFSRRYFDELSRIEPDRGARPLLKKHAENLVTLPFAEGARDLDTPEDFQYWQARFENDEMAR